MLSIDAKNDIPPKLNHWSKCTTASDCNKLGPRCICDKLSFVSLSLEREEDESLEQALEREEKERANSSLYGMAGLRTDECVKANEESWAAKDHGSEWYEQDIPGCCVGSCGDHPKISNSRWSTGVNSDISQRRGDVQEVINEKKMLINEGYDKNTKIKEMKEARKAEEDKQPMKEPETEQEA